MKFTYSITVIKGNFTYTTRTNDTEELREEFEEAMDSNATGIMVMNEITGKILYQK